ncbi:MAG: 30S ribosome-binding factor RbfA [Alphaproteobacteria bacterium]|nr:30S ribosome-binding factor RbfA [Alphaproteobacteria bacterium]
MSRQHGRSRGSAPSQRQLRVGELVRAILSELLMRGEVEDEGLAGVSVTVTEVRVSPDLKHATAFVAPLGGGDPAPVVAALTRARRFLRGEVGHRLDLKFTPEITFRPDTSFDQASRIDALLAEAHRRPRGEEPDEADD